MGAYYKTTDPQDTDFIMQSPTSLMQQGLQETSDQNDQQIKSLDLFGNAIANIHHLPGQEEQVKTIQQGYQQQIDDATNQILKDPANYQKHMPLIRNIQRTLSSDLQNGQLAYYNNTADQYSSLMGQAQQGMLGKDGKPGVFTPEQVQAYKSYILNDYNQRVQANGGKAYDPQTGASVPLSSEGLYVTPNIPSKMKEIEDGIKANSNSYSKDRVTGQWIYTGKSSTEQVEASRVADLVWSSLQSDPEVMGWAKQGQKMGYLNGVAYPQGTKGNYTMLNPDGTDLSGQLIQPYIIDTHGNPIFNQSSMFAPIIRAAIDKQAFKKTVQDESVKDNPYGLEANKSALALNNEKTMAGINNAYKQADNRVADANKLEAEKELAAWKTALGSNQSYQQVIDKVMGSGTINITSSPDGKTTISPFAGADRDVNGNSKPINSFIINSTLIPASNSRLANILSTMKSSSLTDNQRALLQQQYTEEKSNNDFLSDASAKAYTASIGGLVNGKKYTSDDLNNYYNYQRPEIQNTFKQQIQSLHQQLQSLVNPEYTKAMNSVSGAKNGVHGIDPYTDPTKAKEIIQHIQNVNTQVDKYNQVGKDINDGTAKWFKENATSANQTLNGIGLSVPNKQLIFGQLKQNPHVDIRNLNLDASEGSLADKAKIILENVVKGGENLSDYFDIERINSPIKGVGVTATVKLKNPMENKGNFIGNAWRGLTGESVAGKNINTSDFGKTLLMTLPSSVLNSLANNMKSGSTDTEKNMGELINNKAEADLVGSLKQRFIAQTPDGHTGPVGTATYYDPTTKQQLSLTAVPQTVKDNPDATTYKIYIKDNQGNNHLFQTTDNPTGEFASEESAVQKLLGITPSK